MPEFRRADTRQHPIPFPAQQFFILALCRICEPIAFMSIFPYIYFMVESFNITTDDRKISIYAGMVTSAFTLAEFSTGLLWGSLSDKVGRKPILLTGLAGTGLSMMIFGFARNLPLAMLARALGGLLNGNIGVLQTTVGELVPQKEHQPRAYTIMPVVWCLGSILGPSLGGALAQPCVSYPGMCAAGSIFERFPYLLPNLVCTAIVSFGVVVGFLFLEETHAEKKYRRDIGIEAGRWLLSSVPFCVNLESPGSRKPFDPSEMQPLIEGDDQLPSYQTAQESPLFTTTSTEPPEPLSLRFNSVRKKPTIKKAFTKQVVLIIVGYGILAYHTITFDQLLPVFLSTPKKGNESYSSPLRFTGGFGLSTKQIAVILSVQGIYSMGANTIFPIVSARLGCLRLFRLLALCYPLLYFVSPYLVLLSDSTRLYGIYAIIVWKCTFSTFAYPAIAMLLRNSAPSLLLLGTINGAAASIASFCRALGPTISGYLYSTGLNQGYSGLPWWCTALVAAVGGLLSLRMIEKGGFIDEKDEDEEACDIGRIPDLVFEPGFASAELTDVQSEDIYRDHAHLHSKR